MKACVVQLPYSSDYNDSDTIFEKELELFDSCDNSMDIIVFPENCDIPALASTYEEFMLSRRKYTDIMLSKAKETAIRCKATVFVNGIMPNENGGRNTTFAINKNGDVVGHYFKQHLVKNEENIRKLDADYTYEFSEPAIIEIDGIRYGFMICYDCYFYENYANIARKNVDVIIECCHQRSDPHSMSEIITRFCALNCNAYVLRSTVSFGGDSDHGGASMIVAPDGMILANLYNEVGMTSVDINPEIKYYKSAGYGNQPAPHYEYIETGRRPWKYRPAGSAIVRTDNSMPYPRVCAHRGFNTIAPKNTMPAFGAAVALGADEIEFDLWTTRDGEIVSMHDADLDRTSDGTGKVWDYTYDELLKFDFGSVFSDEYKGLRIIKFEDILKKFSCHTIMNIHLKTADNSVSYDESILKKIIALIYKYDCQNHVYFMTGNDIVMKQLLKLAPEITRCMGGGDAPWQIVERAIECKCAKVQLFKPYFNIEMIDKAHRNNIICNVFWSDDSDETVEFLNMGIDTILTNDYNKIANSVDEWLNNRKE